MMGKTEIEGQQEEGVSQAESYANSEHEKHNMGLEKTIEAQVPEGTNVSLLPSDVNDEQAIQRQCQCGSVNGVCQCDFQETEKEVLIYAVGELKPSFPNQGLEKAFNTAARQLSVSEYDYYQVFSYTDTKTQKQPYFYLAQQMDWVLRINHEDCYLLVPRSRAELVCFIDALKKPNDNLQLVYSTIVGVLGDSANYLEGSLPKVLCNHVFSQTLDELHNKLQSETGVATSAIQDVLKQLEFSPNQGNTNYDRAKNYLAFRYPDIYLTTHTLQKGTSVSVDNKDTYFLDEIECRYSDVMSPHTIVDIVLIYKSKNLPVKKYYHCSVDVTRQFPFINTPLGLFMPVEAEQSA